MIPEVKHHGPKDGEDYYDSWEIGGYLITCSLSFSQRITHVQCYDLSANDRLKVKWKAFLDPISIDILVSVLIFLIQNGRLNEAPASHEGNLYFVDKMFNSWILPILDEMAGQSLTENTITNYLNGAAAEVLKIPKNGVFQFTK